MTTSESSPRTRKRIDPGRVLITGASAGIGAALAESFAGRGHDLILVARSAPKLEALAASLREAQRVEIEVIALDLGTAHAADALYLQVERRRLPVGILVNNAGLLHSGAFTETTLQDHLDLLQLNIATLTALTHRFLPAMLARKQGRILNLASTSAFQPLPHLATYAASKAFVLSFSEALALELKGRGISVTALCPGFTETGMIAKEGGQSMQLPFVKNLTVREVAEQGYRACMAGTPLYINGMSNRALVAFGKHQPRWLQRLVTQMISKKGF